jgi:predicted transposase YdaD
MPKKYDAILKHLLERYADGWLEYLAADLHLRHTGPVRVIDADLAAVSAQADKVFRVESAPPWLLHLELQAGRDQQLPARVLKYNVLLTDRHQLLARSVIVLLRPAADGKELDGVVTYRLPEEDSYLEFRYRVVRLWRKPPEQFLAGQLGLLPLAPLSGVTEDQLPGVVRRMAERLKHEATVAEQEDLWTATHLLLGLRFPNDFVAQLLRGVLPMEESSTYQAIIAEGKELGRQEGWTEEARKLLLRQGTKSFGPPAKRVAAALNAITDLTKLEQLSERLLDVSSWEELLDLPPARRRSNGRTKSK